MMLILTEEIRRQIRTKRKALGLSTSELSRRLKIQRVTLQRWENGPTVRCTHALSSLLENFLTGKMDPPFPCHDTPKSTAHHLLDELITLYTESYHTPKLQRQLLASLEKLANELS